MDERSDQTALVWCVHFGCGLGNEETGKGWRRERLTKVLATDVVMFVTFFFLETTADRSYVIRSHMVMRISASGS